MIGAPAPTSDIRFYSRLTFAASLFIATVLTTLALADSASDSQSSASAVSWAPGYFIPNDVELSRRFANSECAIEEALFRDSADGRLDDFTQFQAAIVAGGESDLEELKRYESAFAKLVQKFRSERQNTNATPELVRAAFEFMHKNVFYGGYRIEASDPRTVLSTGKFNCVSAVTLFDCMLDSLGVPASPLRMPSHAMSRAYLSDEIIDVETTCPKWFELRNDPEKRAEIAAKASGTTGASVEKDAKPVTTVQLVAMIYYNRGVDYLAAKEFAQAAKANAKALRLDSTNDLARGNFLATVNNWSIQLADELRFEEAAAALKCGLKFAPAYKPYSQNFVHVYRCWAERCRNEGRADEAVRLLRDALQTMPNQPQLEAFLRDVAQ